MSQAKQEVQMCDWCKGKGVPSHRPQNCRDRANRASRFYEAASAEQDQEDQRAKKAKTTGTPFTYTPLVVHPLGALPPLAREVSAFPPGGCSAVPFKPNY